MELKCNQCGRKIGKNLRGFICPGCGKVRCEDCEKELRRKDIS